jgi:oligopeptide/dipeptide ABC transporter ATP-binding protein
MVLYLGRVVEIGPTETVFSAPRHPYTQALIDAAPVPHPARRRSRTMISGESPSLAAALPGCAFQTRCPQVMAACREAAPPLRDFGAGHHAACLL